MSQLLNNLSSFINEIKTYHSPIDVVLATKYASIENIGEITSQNKTIIFGENRVQSGEEKQTAYPNISNPWHFIGHLQRNKVKKVLGNYALIHSVDSIRLMDEIEKQASTKNITSNILLQINPLQEESKSGFSEDEIYAAIDHSKSFTNTSVTGLMVMAPLSNDIKPIENTFKKSRSIYDKIKKEHKELTHLSMGMSNDYKIAINEGSTMIRIGSIIFKDVNNR